MTRNLAVAAIILMTVAAVMLDAYYLRQREHIEEQQREFHALLFSIAENGVRAHIRADMYHPEHLGDWFVGLAAAVGLGEIRLTDGSGKDMVRVEGLEDTGDIYDYQEIQDEVARFETLSRPGWFRGGPRGRGAGSGGGWRKLPPGPYTFCMKVDREAWEGRYAHLRNQVVFGAFMAFIAIILGISLLFYRTRQAQLNQDLVSAQADAARQSMLATMGSGLAHETKNPLGLIRGIAQSILDQETSSPETRDRALRIIDESDRVAGEIDKFLGVAKPVELHKETVSLSTLFENIAVLVRDEAKAASIAFTVNASGLTLVCDVERLRKAILNLVLNAFKACHAGDSVSLSAEKSDPHHACIIVSDTGCGIRPEDLPHVTEPYFHKFDVGTGLGLAITAEIARDYGGRLILESEPGKGTTARLTKLPLGKISNE